MRPGFTQEFNNSREVFSSGGDAGDKRYSGMDGGRFFLKKPTEIIKYLLVRLAGILLVNFWIGDLDVVVDEVYVRKYLLSENVIREVPGCLKNNV